MFRSWVSDSISLNPPYKIISLRIPSGPGAFPLRRYLRRPSTSCHVTFSHMSQLSSPPSSLCPTCWSLSQYVHFPSSSQCFANSSTTSAGSSTTFPHLVFILGMLIFFRQPPFESPQNLQFGPPCSLIFFIVLFLISFFSFLISFLTNFLLFLYFSHFLCTILSCAPLLFASLNSLHIAFLRNWESWPKAANEKDGLKVLGNSGRQKCSRQQIGG